MDKARSLWPDQPYWINTDFGGTIMLPPALADEIRNQSMLSFSKALYRDFHGGIPGFEPATLSGKNFELLLVVVRKHLTKLLGVSLCPRAKGVPRAADGGRAV